MSKMFVIDTEKVGVDNYIVNNWKSIEEKFASKANLHKILLRNAKKKVSKIFNFSIFFENLNL